jgi:hypothetical protein
MAEPRAGPESGELPHEQRKARYNLETCFRKSPDIDEAFSTAGKNSKRLLQARQDESLNVTYITKHEDPRRSKSIYKILPRPSRKLHAQATYCWDQKRDERLHVWIVVADDSKYLLKPDTIRTLGSLPPHTHRALFNIGHPNIGVRTLQLLQHTIGDLCERCKSMAILSQSLPYLCVTITDHHSSAEPSLTGPTGRTTQGVHHPDYAPSCSTDFKTASDLTDAACW